jgi:CrcB protein
MTWLLVALGAAAGAAARYLTDVAVSKRRPEFPWGTLVVNVTGSFAVGVVAGAALGPAWVALLGTGFCGAFTTWSTLALDAVMLARSGAWWPAVLDVVVSVAAGLVAVSVGVHLGASG